MKLFNLHFAVVVANGEVDGVLLATHISKRVLHIVAESGAHRVRV